MPRKKIIPVRGVTEERITLQDVARAANVHHTTVSRSLRDDPQIAEATRHSICKLAEKMGYEPDPMLTALSRYRMRKQEASYHGTLAWLTFGRSSAGNPQPQPAQFFAISEEWGRRKGYRFEAFDIRPEGPTPDKVRRILIARGIRGILLPPQLRSGITLEMDFSGFSVVTIGNTLESPDLHRVGPAQYENSRSLASALIARHKDKVGFYLPAILDERTNGKFSAGFWRAQERLDKDHKGPIFLPQEYDEKKFIEWFKKNSMDVLITTSQPILEWLERIGIQCPRDIKIAFPGDPQENLASYWMQENWTEIYHSAVDFLVSQIERNSTGIPEHPHRISVPGTLKSNASHKVPSITIAKKAKVSK